MAASHSFLKYAEPGARIRTRPPQLEPTANIRLVLGFHKLLLKLACPSHAWNWPRPIQGERLDGFDAHQTCFKCLTQRFYNTQTLKAGPLYRSRVPGPPVRTLPGFQPLASLRKLHVSTHLGKQLFKLGRSPRG